MPNFGAYDVISVIGDVIKASGAAILHGNFVQIISRTMVDSSDLPFEMLTRSSLVYFAKIRSELSITVF